MVNMDALPGSLIYERSAAGGKKGNSLYWSDHQFQQIGEPIRKNPINPTFIFFHFAMYVYMSSARTVKAMPSDASLGKEKLNMNGRC